MELAMINNTIEREIICNLNALSEDERLEHLKLSVEILTKLPIVKDETEEGFYFIYKDTKETYFNLTKWIYFEHTCCSWAKFNLETESSTNCESMLILKMSSNSKEGKNFFRLNIDYIHSIEIENLSKEAITLEWRNINKTNCCKC